MQLCVLSSLCCGVHVRQPVAIVVDLTVGREWTGENRATVRSSTALAFLPTCPALNEGVGEGCGQSTPPHLLIVHLPPCHNCCCCWWEMEVEQTSEAVMSVLVSVTACECYRLPLLTSPPPLLTHPTLPTPTQGRYDRGSTCAEPTTDTLVYSHNL
jgi:hypothetical protein